MNGYVVAKVSAYGKHLFITFENELVIHVHLGLYGKWTIAAGAPVDVRGEIRLRIVGDTHYAELRGPSKCELITVEQMRAVIKNSGVDPLRKGADPSSTWQRVRASKTAIGAQLMNQQLFAGVGNIYRVEVLFRAGVSPFKPGQALTDEQCDEIWSDLVELMRYGVKHGRIDTVRDEHTPEVMGREPRVDRHGGEVYVYRRAGLLCFVCSTPISAQTMQGRNLYWCASCQPD